MSVRQRFSNGARHFASQRGNGPILKIVLGLLLFAFFLLALMLQIQTSEAFFLSGPAVSLAPNWVILRQPWDLVRGQLGMEIAKAVMWAWGVELVYLVCVVGDVVVHNRMQRWFKFGAVLLVAYDFWSDFSYGSVGSSGFMSQLAFAGITAFIVAFFGQIGLNFLFSGFLEAA
jgi:hypothetical protein